MDTRGSRYRNEHKLRAYKLQDDGLDTVDANLQQGLPISSPRIWSRGPRQICRFEDIQMRLMTNNPVKYGGLEGYGLDIVGRIPLHFIDPNEENIRYLRTKKERLGHDLIRKQ